MVLTHEGQGFSWHAQRANLKSGAQGSLESQEGFQTVFRWPLDVILHGRCPQQPGILSDPISLFLCCGAVTPLRHVTPPLQTHHCCTAVQVLEQSGSVARLPSLSRLWSHCKAQTKGASYQPSFWQRPRSVFRTQSPKRTRKEGGCLLSVLMKEEST